MTDEQLKIMNQLEKIMQPKRDHIEKLERLCTSSKNNPVAADFLNHYSTEYAQYQELKLLLLQEFSN